MRAAHRPQAPTAARCRVLVVDDNVDAADSLALLLSMLGHEVRTAYDGPTALRTAPAFGPHVVLLDLGLPRMDGLEVARQMRQLDGLRDVLVIATTGHGREEDRRRCREAGFDDFLLKPLDLDELARRLAAKPGEVTRPGNDPPSTVAQQGLA